MIVTVCMRCLDASCDPCPGCGVCSTGECACEPTVITALGGEGRCEGCGRPIHAGDEIRRYADDVVVHESCPARGKRAQA